MVLPLILGLTQPPFLCLFKPVSFFFKGGGWTGRQGQLVMVEQNEFWYCSLNKGKKCLGCFCSSSV